MGLRECLGSCRNLGCNVTLVVDEFAKKLWEVRSGNCRG